MTFPDLVLSHLTHNYYVVRDIDPSNIETMTGNFNHSSYRLGQEDSGISVSITPLEGIQSTGSAVGHTLSIMETQNGVISYTLLPSIQFGDEIKYVLHTDFGGWTRHDTIVKTFESYTLQFAEDATTTTSWTGNWSTTTSEFVSPSRSFTDSPSGDYQNNTFKTYTLNEQIDLTNVSAALCSFYAKWDIEPDFDYARLEVSTDNGNSWIGQCGHYTHAGSSENGSVQPAGEPVYDGIQSEWILEEISLSDYIGENIKLRFILESDAGVKADGFYFDDFKVFYNEIVDHTGLNELDLSIKAVPNPADEQVYISFGNPVSEGKICWYDLTGKEIGSVVIHDVVNKVILPTSELPQGVYTVRYISENRYSIATKIMVVH